MTKKKIKLFENTDLPWITTWILLIIVALAFDTQIMDFVKLAQIGWLTTFFTAVTFVMALSWGIAIVILAIGFFTEHKTFFGSMISLIVTLGIIFLLKEWVPKIRPNLLGQSFPSGHSARAFALAGYLEKVYDKKIFYVMAGLIALSRVYLLEHFASDALIGALIGVVIAEIVFRLNIGETIEKLLKF